MSKPRVSIELTPTQRANTILALDFLRDTYAPAWEVWLQLTSSQREQLLEHCPLLNRLYAWAVRFTEQV